MGPRVIDTYYAVGFARKTLQATCTTARHAALLSWKKNVAAIMGWVGGSNERKDMVIEAKRKDRGDA